MNMPQLRKLAAEYGCTIDTDHSSHFISTCDVWAVFNKKRERIGLWDTAHEMSREELAKIFETVSGKSLKQFWTGGNETVAIGKVEVV